MVEENAVTCKEIVTLSIVHRHPIRVDFRSGIGALRLKGVCSFNGAGTLPYISLLRRLIELRFDSRFANGFQQSNGAKTRNLARILRHVKADAYVALSSQMVNFGRLYRTNDRFNELPSFRSP